MYVKGAADDNGEDYDDSCYRQVYEIEQEITTLLPVFQRYMADNGIVMKLFQTTRKLLQFFVLSCLKIFN